MSDLSPDFIETLLKSHSENAKLKSTLHEYRQQIEYLEKEVSRLKMLLAGNDPMMNSFSTPRNSK